MINRRDALVLLPTGGGKSICFQVPALTSEGICIVISPLIALMRDQVQNLKSRGIKAVALVGGMRYEEVDAVLDNCIYGNYKFLYLSPERLQQELVIERLKQMSINLIAIDEAHCISQWGNDFRPAYRNCGLLKEMFPDVPLAALTASATKKVVDDILENLHIPKASIYKKSFARPNIAYMVFEEEDKLYRLLQILRKNPQSSIVYVRNRKATVDIAEHLNAKGITAGFFHGGIPTADKEEKLRLWLNGDLQVMVATNAFGMGIDKPDVRTVIHMNLPESMESYYQEAGRAGRNGNKSFAIVLKHPGDESILKKQFLEQLPDVAFVKQVYRKLNNYFQISYGEGENAEFFFNFNRFCSTYQLNISRTYNSLKLLDRNSVISLSEQFDKKTTLQFTVSSARLFHYLETNPSIAATTQAILRTYGGVFESETRIAPQLIAKKLNVPEAQILNALEQLAKDDIIAYQAENTDAKISFLVPREDDITINIIAENIKKQNRQKQEEVASVIRYMDNDKDCKSRQILSYFGETDTANCGICSVCIGSSDHHISAETWKTIAEEIVKTLKTAPKSSRELTEVLTFEEPYILRVLKGMLEEDKIRIDDKNQYQLKS